MVIEKTTGDWWLACNEQGTGVFILITIDVSACFVVAETPWQGTMPVDETRIALGAHTL